MSSTINIQQIKMVSFKHVLRSMVEISVSDPYHFDLDPDPDPRIRIRDHGSGSGS